MGASSSSSAIEEEKPSIKPLKISESDPRPLRDTPLYSGYYFDNKLYVCTSKLKF
jgi:hypothetical protein